MLFSHHPQSFNIIPINHFFINSLLLQDAVFLVCLLPPWQLNVSFLPSSFLVNMANFHVLVLAHCFPLSIPPNVCSVEEGTFSFPSSPWREEKLFYVTDKNLRSWLGHIYYRARSPSLQLSLLHCRLPAFMGWDVWRGLDL